MIGNILAISVSIMLGALGIMFVYFPFGNCVRRGPNPTLAFIIFIPVGIMFLAGGYSIWVFR